MRQIEYQLEFRADGTFQSFYAAQKWCKENGLDYGSPDVPNPIAIVEGDYSDSGLPQKWHNFTNAGVNSVAGIIEGNFREGPVFVKMYVKN